MARTLAYARIGKTYIAAGTADYVARVVGLTLSDIVRITRAGLWRTRTDGVCVIYYTDVVQLESKETHEMLLGPVGRLALASGLPENDILAIVDTGREIDGWVARTHTPRCVSLPRKQIDQLKTAYEHDCMRERTLANLRPMDSGFPVSVPRVRRHGSTHGRPQKAVKADASRIRRIPIRNRVDSEEEEIPQLTPEEKYDIVRDIARACLN